jgi:4-amino-4-deoxychorismate lyase
METACLVNGEVYAYVPAGDRGLAYGDGLFETLVVERGRPRFWQGHMDRLQRGCSVLHIAMPPQELLLREVLTVAAGRSACVVKIILTRGAAGRGYAPPRDGQPTRFVAAYELPADLGDAQRRGVRGRVCDLRLALQPALGGIKHLNRLEQVLAAMEMRAHPGLEGILLNQEGFVVGAISANLFLVCGDTLITPRMDRSGVRGVTRNLILRDFKARTELRRVTPDMLEEADELFLCNAVRGVMPLVEVDGHEWPAGPVTRELQSWFERRAGGA